MAEPSGLFHPGLIESTTPERKAPSLGYQIRRAPTPIDPKAVPDPKVPFYFAVGGLERKTA